MTVAAVTQQGRRGRETALSGPTGTTPYIHDHTMLTLLAENLITKKYVQHCYSFAVLYNVCVQARITGK
jgi:hypothetical protein